MEKAFVVSLIYWVTIPLGLPVLSQLAKYGVEGLYWFVLDVSAWLPTAIGLGTSMLWGWLLGRLWTREGQR